MKTEEYKKINKVILEFLSKYLNDYSKSINKEDILEVTNCKVSEEYAYSLLLASLFGLDIEKNNDIFSEYFIEMVRQENKEDYYNNPYFVILKNNIKELKNKEWTFKWDKYNPFEGFVRNDIKKYLNGKILPQIGFFNTEFTFPAIYQNDRLWMSITPNEVNTFKTIIENVKGKVLMCGLGMGYFAYMASIKNEVDSITIVEIDENAIELFKDNLLPLYENKNKINVIKKDAFKFLKNNQNYDYIVIDLWHDVSDGLSMYKELKKIENNPNAKYYYWIEQTLKCYD